MSKKQLGALFLSSLAMFTAGNGLIPLLPIYAIQLGAEAAIAGYYLSFSYFMLAVGVFHCWLAIRFVPKQKGSSFICRRAVRIFNMADGQSNKHLATDNIDRNHLVFRRHGSSFSKHSCWPVCRED